MLSDIDAGCSSKSPLDGLLAEGADVGAYRIVEVLTGPSRVRLDTR